VKQYFYVSYVYECTYMCVRTSKFLSAVFRRRSLFLSLSLSLSLSLFLSRFFIFLFVDKRFSTVAYSLGCLLLIFSFFLLSLLFFGVHFGVESEFFRCDQRDRRQR